MKKIKEQKIEELLNRGVEKIADVKHLAGRLAAGEVLRVKHGIDPTGPKIHLGRAAQLLKLRDFQDLGHKIVLIIGDFTAQIGDASDKQAARRPHPEKEVRSNMRNYAKQIGRILDMKKVELRFNSRWLGRLKAKELLFLAMYFSAQQTIQRRNFKERWEQGKPIGLHELFYPLLQGYDSFILNADVELGGFDQLFNLETGRDVQKIFGQEPQDIVTLKMLLGPDGRKMSTSWGNAVYLTDSPKEQFGKIMSIKDELVADYFELCTRVPLAQVRKLLPREAKAKLAVEIVSLCHGEKAAKNAEKEFNRVFREKGLPNSVPAIKIKAASLGILDLLVVSRLASSKAEAKRLVTQGGVKIDGRVQKDWRARINIRKNQILQAGKRKFVKII